MKKISSLELGATFAGCFLGAGFISGQEIFQFFGSFGIRGIWGLALAIGVMLVFGMLLVDLARRTGITELDRIVVGRAPRALQPLVAGMALFLLIGIYVIMSAGAASLIHRVAGVPTLLGAALFCLLVAGVATAGLSGMVKVFSLAVPALTAAAVVIVIWTMARWGVSGLDFTPRPTGNPLLATWWISGLTFVSYNLFGALGAVTPMGRRVPDRKTVLRGISLGCGALTLIAVSILLSFAVRPEITGAALPMLDLAFELAAPMGLLFAALLLCGMFGTSLSAVVAIAAFLKAKRFRLREHVTILGLSFLAWLGSQIGFSRLISVVYPLCGYFGLAAMALLAVHYVQVSRSEKNTAREG